MTSTFKKYVWVVGIAAIILTAIVGLYPAIKDYPVPTFVYLFVPSLVFDIYMLGKIQRGEVPPLTGMDRGLAMIAAALFHMTLTKLLFG